MTCRHKNVLIADCHEDVLISLEHLLENAGYATTTAWTAEDALAALESVPVNLLLANEYLPDRNVEDLLQEIRGRNLTVSCIVMQPSSPRVTDRQRFSGLAVIAVVCKHKHGEVLEAVDAFFKDSKKAPDVGQLAYPRAR